ncbi:MAG: M3 family oligoendopeptidase [Pseudomonadales bacterium]|nr:M3 family oligoendopeptidase [Pseudomonadales bacterium]
MLENPVTGPAWDLSSEYESVSSSALRADLDSLSIFLDEAETHNRHFTANRDLESAQALTKLREQASTLLSNVGTYAHCLLSVDSQLEDAQKLNGELQSFHKRFGDVFEPLSQFVDDADDTTIAEYLSDPAIEPNAFLVLRSRERAHENLTLAEESLVNGLSQDGIHAWGKLYDQLAGSLTCCVSVGNEEQEMGIAQASALMSSADDHQRKAAWAAINEAWSAHDESTSASLNAISGWRLEMAKQRSRTQDIHFLDAPTHMNRISRSTLDTLLDVAAQAKPLAQKAARLQARAYGKSGFGPWDLRAPAPNLAASGRIAGDTHSAGVSFADSLNLIADAYGQVDGSMADFVRMMAENKWIEGTTGPRKSPGAYCTGFAKSKTPRVYMTYTGGQSDTITLAHELGHAYHSWVMRDLPDSQKSYGMSLAETASTFGETLVRDALLDQAQADQERLNIMWEEMSAFTAFLLNIPARFEFERNLYKARAERPLRPQELKDMMSAAWQTWYGDALSEPDPMFWASKLHFYISGISFYNFPYLFGYLFSLGVYARRESAGDQFFPQYVDLLRDTGRMTAEDIAKKHLDADLTDQTFWLATIATLEHRVSAFEGLLDELGV